MRTKGALSPTTCRPRVPLVACTLCSSRVLPASRSTTRRRKGFAVCPRHRGDCRPFDRPPCRRWARRAVAYGCVLHNRNGFSGQSRRWPFVLTTTTSVWPSTKTRLSPAKPSWTSPLKFHRSAECCRPLAGVVDGCGCGLFPTPRTVLPAGRVHGTASAWDTGRSIRTTPIIGRPSLLQVHDFQDLPSATV